MIKRIGDKDYMIGPLNSDGTHTVTELKEVEKTETAYNKFSAFTDHGYAPKNGEPKGFTLVGTANNPVVINGVKNIYPVSDNFKSGDVTHKRKYWNEVRTFKAIVQKEAGGDLTIREFTLEG